MLLLLRTQGLSAWYVEELLGEQRIGKVAERNSNSTANSGRTGGMDAYGPIARVGLVHVGEKSNSMET